MVPGAAGGEDSLTPLKFGGNYTGEQIAEAASNLDNESEAIVPASINQISETITTFIIAHRLSTIRRAEKRSM